MIRHSFKQLSAFLTAPVSMQVSLKFYVILEWLIHVFNVFYSIIVFYRQFIDLGFMFTFALQSKFGARPKNTFFICCFCY